MRAVALPSGVTVGGTRARTPWPSLAPAFVPEHPSRQESGHTKPVSCLFVRTDRPGLTIGVGHSSRVLLARASDSTGVLLRIRTRQVTHRPTSNRRPLSPQVGSNVRTAAQAWHPWRATARGTPPGCGPTRIRRWRRNAAPDTASCWNSAPDPSRPANRRVCRRWH